MKIIATLVHAGDLKYGDLFSFKSQRYWDSVNSNCLSVGEKVYIRTNKSISSNDSEEINVALFRITIETNVSKQNIPRRKSHKRS